MRSAGLRQRNAEPCPVTPDGQHRWVVRNDRAAKRLYTVCSACEARLWRRGKGGRRRGKV